MKRQLFATALLAVAAHAPAQTNSQAQTPLKAQAPTPAKAESSASTLWSSLWHNADQRAQALLQQGHASDAAKLYTDPRRKAYAQIKAGDYAAAASGLKTLNDAEAHYNRGNALAQAGDLQGAIDAYDAALKQNPTHQDARHNRDLVAKALQKQKDAQKNQPQDKPQDGKPQDKKDGSQNGQPGDKPDSGQGSQPDHKAGEKASDKPGDKPHDKSAAQQDKQQADNPNSKPGDKAQPNQGSTNQPGAAGKPDAAQPQPAASDAEQARRDVNATLQPKANGATGDAGNAQGNATAPMTEKQIAQEQWLRSIPDDPGGLLRRKFLIEHLMRQRDAKP